MGIRWMDSALCAQVDLELFFPEKCKPQDSYKAKRICARCPVAAECLEYGMNMSHGIFGGLGERERRQLRNQRSNAA